MVIRVQAHYPHAVGIGCSRVYSVAHRRDDEHVVPGSGECPRELMRYHARATQVVRREIVLEHRHLHTTLRLTGSVLLRKLDIRIEKQLHEIFERRLWLPAEIALRLGCIAHEDIDL